MNERRPIKHLACEQLEEQNAEMWKGQDASGEAADELPLLGLTSAACSRPPVKSATTEPFQSKLF